MGQYTVDEAANAIADDCDVDQVCLAPAYEVTKSGIDLDGVEKSVDFFDISPNERYLKATGRGMSPVLLLSRDHFW